MGHVLIEIGDADGARLAFEEALDCFRREGSRVMQAWCLYGLAEILRREGHLLEAAEMLSEVERLFLASGDPSILPNVWRRQADVAMDRADARAAASLYCKAGLNHAKQGDTGSHWSYLRELAGSELADGHARNAVSLCAAASRLRQECRLASDDRLDSFANELRTKLPQCDFEPLWRASEAIADEYSGQPATSAEAVA
jgi:tetratricopeptide (TPR) repeat protein